MEVNVATLPHKKNIHEFSDIINFCAENEVHTFRVQPFMPIGRGAEYNHLIALSDEMYVQLKETLYSAEL